MKYRGSNLQQNIVTGKYEIFDVFGKKMIEEDFATIAKAKEAADVLNAKVASNRFQPVHHSKYWWGIIDKNTHLYYLKENGKPLLFKSREECFNWCDKNNIYP